ncbi:MAG TPA: PHB depolymerase family esterase, partial [Planctomycetota bacterium]|nr:PHB depolymerase family esterase [Planctomycetota bacterium]
MRRSAWICLTLIGCAWLRPLEEHSISGSLKVGALDRTYILHVPPSLPKDRPAPLVLVFHGGGGQGKQMEGFTGFSALSDKEGFIVGYPDGLEKNWYDGRVVEASRAHREKIDDLAFVDALIDEIGRRHPVDPKRIYATGISNGAFFSHWLAAHRSARIAAIAPVVGGMSPALAESFKPEGPVSVLILQGTEDPLVPYSGGEIKH